MTRSEQKALARESMPKDTGKAAVQTWDGRPCDRYESLKACRAASIVDFRITAPKSRTAPGTDTGR